MENREKYIARLQQALQNLDQCSARHVESVRVNEVFRGEISWEGTVEVFEVTGHAKTKRAYCWSHLQGQHDSTEDFVALLAIPPIESPLDAVRAAIVGEVKTGRR